MKKALTPILAVVAVIAIVFACVFGTQNGSNKSKLDEATAALNAANDSIKALDIRARAYRNRRIGDFLKELKLTEGRNTGFPTAFAALRENGSDMPTFEMDNARGYLSVKIPVHPYFVPKTKARNSAYDAKILSILENKPLNLTDLSKEMGYKGITQKLRKAVDALFVTGMIEKIPSEEYGVLFRKKQ